MQWPLQEAKAKFSKLVRLAAQSPQIVTVRGVEEVVVVSKKRYDALTARHKTLVQFFRDSPLRETLLDLKRDRTPPRDLTL